MRLVSDRMPFLGALRHPLATGALALASTQYPAAALGLLSNIVAARLLSTADYGVAATILAYPTLLWSLVAVKSTSVTTTYIAGARATGGLRTVAAVIRLGYALDFALAVAAFALAALSAPLVSNLIVRAPDAGWLILVAAASLPLASTNGTSLAILSSLGRFGRIGVLQVVEEAIMLALVLLFLERGGGFGAFVLASVLSQCLGALLRLRSAAAALHGQGVMEWWRGPRIPPALRREILGAFRWNYLTVTLSGVTTHVPLLLLAHYRGPEDAGFYRLANTLAIGACYLEAAATRAVHPDVSGRVATGDPTLRRTLTRWTMYGGVPIAGAVALGVAVLPLVVSLVFGARYEAMVSGAQLMMAAGIGTGLLFWLHPLYFATGRLAAFSKTHVLYVLCVVPLAWRVARDWGFVGMAVLYLAGRWALSAALLVQARPDGPAAGSPNEERRSSITRVCFIGGTRYEWPLTQTVEKKFKVLAQHWDIDVVGFAAGSRFRHERGLARFYLLPCLPWAPARYALMAIGGLVLVTGIIRAGARVVVAQSPLEGCVARAARALARLVGARSAIVVESHGDFERSPLLQRRVRAGRVWVGLLRALARWSIRGADCLRAVSSSTEQQLHRFAPEKPTVRFLTWSDAEVFFATPRRVDYVATSFGTSGPPTVLYAGSLIPGKGVHHLLRAFAAIAGESPSVRLLVVGPEENRDYAAECRRWTARHGLDARVSFLGRVGQRELAQLMAEAAVFVLPTYSEGFPRVVVEAMAVGVPIVASAVSGIPELVTDGVTGLLVPAGDEKALTHRLRWVLADPARAEALGRRGREVAARVFGAEQYVAGYRELFGRCVGA